jgi:hypothetical protein
VASGDLLITSNVARGVNVLLSATPPAAKLVVTSEPDDATITVDGKEVGRTPTTVAVAPGTTHILRVGKDGWDTSTRTVSGRAGETLKIDVSLRPVAPPSVATTPERPSETPAPPARQRPGRTALLIGGVALGAAALAGGISIYTWRRFSDRKGEAEALLDPMYRSSPDDVKVSANEWFRHPDCNVPKGVPASESRARYETLCAEGTTAASATTGLLIGTGVLAAVAATSFGVGINLARNDEKDRGAKRALAPRLRLIEPVVTQQGGGLSASFEF